MVLIYGVVAYLFFLATFLYLIGFVGNVGVPKSIDSPPYTTLGWAMLINGLLIGLFVVQHSIMARPLFKQWWTQFIPKPAERSTFVIATNLAFVLLFWQWRAVDGVVWSVESPAGRAILYTVFAAGWLTVLWTTCLINHFDLFGLRQVWLHFRGKPYKPLEFVTPGPYRYVRHPMYVGMLAAFWATPTMMPAHLIFAVGLTVYIVLIGIPLEERNLAQFLGRAYADYRRRVPMLLPHIGKIGSHKSKAGKPKSTPV